jgi:hypothetical protein
VIRCSTCPREIAGTASDPFIAVERGEEGEPTIVCQSCAGSLRAAGITGDQAMYAGMVRGWLPWPEPPTRRMAIQ